MTKAEDGRRKFLFDDMTNFLYSPEISPETETKIEIIKKFLQDNPEFSYLILFNHISYNDPAIVLHLAGLIDPLKTRHIVLPTSFSHTDPVKPVSRMFYYLAKGVEWCGVEIIRVIQTYQVNNPKYGYTEEQARETYMNYMRRLKSLRGTPTGVLISPEGHRSDDGALIAAQSGMVAAGRILAPMMYIPLAISYPGKYNRDSINLFKKMKIDIGEAVVQTDPKIYPKTEELMKNLAEALPENMRGVWR